MIGGGKRPPNWADVSLRKPARKLRPPEARRAKSLDVPHGIVRTMTVMIDAAVIAKAAMSGSRLGISESLS